MTVVFEARAISLVEPAAPLACWLALVTGQVEAVLVLQQALEAQSPAKALEPTKPTRDRTTRVRFMILMSDFCEDSDRYTVGPQPGI